MSAVEFGLTPQIPFVSAPPVAPFEQHFAESEAAQLLADLSESLLSGA